MLRMYVDEVGNTDLNSSHDPNHQYLSLTGVIFELRVHGPDGGSGAGGA